MSINRVLILVSGLCLLGGICCSCSGGDTGTANTDKIDTNAAKDKQAGAGGTKAAHGGGMALEPEAPKAGEKVGDPGKGAKAGG